MPANTTVSKVLSYRFLTAQRVVHTVRDEDAVKPVAEHDGMTACALCPPKWLPDVVIAQVWEGEADEATVEGVVESAHLRGPELDGQKPN